MLNVTRWEPFREFEKLPEQMVRLFGFPTIRPYTAEEALTVADFMPPVDIYETEKEYLIKLDLPELHKEEVKVFVEDGVLSIQGERKKEKEEKGKKFLRIERSYGTFLRTFTVPPDADETRIAPMLIQPLVENAIWHGLLPNVGNKQLNILFYREEDRLVCEIEDNGIGIRRSLLNKKDSPQMHTSMGIGNIRQRIALYCDEITFFSCRNGAKFRQVQKVGIIPGCSGKGHLR